MCCMKTIKISGLFYIVSKIYKILFLYFLMYKSQGGSNFHDVDQQYFSSKNENLERKAYLVTISHEKICITKHHVAN